MGFVEYLDLVRYYNESDICVFPSWYENYPAVCLEAMSCGKAVLGSSNGGMSEIIEHKKTGLLFDPFLPNDFKTKLTLLIKDSKYAAKLGKNAKKSVDTKFDRTQIARSIRLIYLKVIKKKKQELNQNFLSL